MKRIIFFTSLIISLSVWIRICYAPTGGGGGSGGTALYYYVVDGKTYSQDELGIQEAIDDCYEGGGGVVFLPAGTYDVSSTIILKSNVKLIGASKDTTIINWTGSSDDNIFELTDATLTDTSTLLSDATEFETKITLSSGQGANFSANDLIYIENTTDNQYQINEVVSISGDTL